MFMKRICSMILVAAMLLTAVACGKSGGEVSDTTTTAPVASGDVTTTTAVEETTVPVETGFSESIPEEDVKALGLDGYTVNVFMRKDGTDWSNKDIWVETMTGDVFNDAVFERNSYLEDTYGFKFQLSYSVDTYAHEIRTYVQAQDDTYDLAFPQARSAATTAQQGCLMDMNQLNYIDPKSDCWNHVFNDEMVFDGRLFFITGDIYINAFKSTRVMMFNKDILAENKLESPYELVNSGKWTIDKMHEMSAKTNRDLNGDQQMTMDDQWGMAMQKATAGLPMFYGAGLKAVEMVDGLPQVTLDSTRASDVFDKIVSVLSDESVYYLGADKDALAVFSEGRALFYAEVLLSAVKLRSSDVVFGLIPAPKYDEAQDFYRAYADCYCISPAVIPASAKNPELSAFVLQATSEASTTTTRPAYYDVAPTYKQLYDEESREMLDLIFDNFTLDACDLYQWGGIVSSITNTFARSGGSNLTTLLAQNKRPIEATIKRTVAQYNSIP